MTRWSEERPESLGEASLVYLDELLPEETPSQKSLRQFTATCPNAHMQISRRQAALLAWVVGLTGAKRVLELGVFTGYSALTMAQAMPEDGQLIACDISDHWLSVAKAHWQRGGVEQMIQFRHGPALNNLKQLLESPEESEFDLIFIDADKRHYADYYEQGLKLLRLGGVMVLDNILVNGKVVSDGERSQSAQMMKALNQRIVEDRRVSAISLPLSDGMTLLRKCA